MCMCVECAEIDYKILRYRQMAKEVDALTSRLVDELINELQEQKTARHSPTGGPQDAIALNAYQ